MRIGSAIVFSLCSFVTAFVVAYGWQDVTHGQAPQIGTVTKALGIGAPAETAVEPTKAFLQTVANIDANFYGSLDHKKLTYAGLEGAMDSLGDPYTVLMEPEEAQKFAERSTGQFQGTGGIGAELAPDPLGARIRRVFRESPAKAAGLKADDVITKVNGVTVPGRVLEDVVKTIRGEVGTEVHLQIYRESAKTSLNFVVKRAVVKIQDVYGEVLGGPKMAGKPKIGRLEVRSFSERIVEQFDQELDILDNAGIDGLIIDLRGNPGGLLNAAVQLASRYIDGKLICTMKRRDGDPEKYFAMQGVVRARDYPIVILIDENSASAAEIFAGAMHDYKIAELVGQHSFGKGLVQSTKQLPDGAEAKITIGRYYLPNGESVQRIEGENGEYLDGGIKPDLSVEFKRGGVAGDPVKDSQLSAAIDRILSKLKQ